MQGDARHIGGGTPFTHEIRVYYADTDAGGIVYHAQYLVFAERCRSELLRACDYPLISEAGHHFVVRDARVTWHAPARLDDLLTCATTITRLSGARVQMEQAFTLNTRQIAKVVVELAHVSQDHRPVRVPRILQERMQVFAVQ